MTVITPAVFGGYVLEKIVKPPCAKVRLYGKYWVWKSKMPEI
jgi:hypothetical protein